jgi:D-amino-acid oxidase
MSYDIFPSKAICDHFIKVERAIRFKLCNFTFICIRYAVLCVVQLIVKIRKNGSLKMIKTQKLLFAIMSLTLCSLSYVQATHDLGLERRYIKPPLLDEKHLGRRILCHRPMRQGAPRMEIEYKENKIIAHNYGHGGSGWTLAPGCAKYVISMLEKSPYAADLTKDTPITIIGAGALGLFTAYDLVNRGYKKITIVAEKFDSLTSHNAGGLLAPVSMNNSPEMQKEIDRIGVEAYKFYKEIAEDNNEAFKKGAVIVPTYFKNREESGLEPYVGKVMQPAKDVIIDFKNGKSHQMVVYDDGIFIDTGIMMEHLTNYLRPKVKFIEKKITNLKEIETRYVINCAGIGSKSLLNDQEMVSVQGHLIMLEHQDPKSMQYMILVYFGEEENKNGQKVKRSFYIFPKKLPKSSENNVGVIGGTFIEGATATTPNEEEFNILLKGAKEFYGIQ